jgi:SAM-dependent methyltransferase
VACGTGTHIKFFLDKYHVFGLDLADEMLDLARERYPDVHFYNLSMIDFDVDERFGAIVCLFGSIMSEPSAGQGWTWWSCTGEKTFRWAWPTSVESSQG